MGDCKPIMKFLRRSQVSTLLLILEALLTTDAQNAPLNAAANVGDRVVISCTTGASMIPRWRYSPTGTGPFTSISYTGSCVSLIPTRFVVESTGNGNCNLIIPSATTTEALVYQCEDGMNFDHYVLLTIIESVEVFPNSAAAEEPCPDDPLNITCSVRYSAVSTPGFKMFPSIMWTNLSANVNISGTDLTSPNVITSYLSIVSSPPTVPPYSCNVYFSAPNLPPSYATNAPNYYKSTNTAQIQVGCIKLNASSIIVTSYIESGICEAKILECHPYAYPPPHDIHWLDVIRNEVVNGTRITAEFGGEYVCSATNAIKTVTVTYKLNDDSAFTMDKCKSVSEVNITESMNITLHINKANTWNKIGLQSHGNAYNCEIAENVNATLITCTANGLPNPTYVWYDQCQNQISTDQQIIVTPGSYSCVANNSINERNFIGISAIEIALPDD